MRRRIDATLACRHGSGEGAAAMIHMAWITRHSARGLAPPALLRRRCMWPTSSNPRNQPQQLI
jgi:hypothetical protein